MSIITHPANAIIPEGNELETMKSMAKILADSGMLPDALKGKPQAVFAIMQKGRELGVPPMLAMTNIVVVKGKPTANSELMAALIYRDHGGDALTFVKSDDQECVIRFKRSDAKQSGTHRFTIEEARSAGLFTNDVWKKYPAAMLRARCISSVARFAFSDSIGGMYTPEELGEPVDEEGNVLAVTSASTRQAQPAHHANPDAFHVPVTFESDPSGDVTAVVEGKEKPIDGEFEEKEEGSEMISDATFRRLWATIRKADRERKADPAKIAGWTPEEVHAYMKEKFPDAKDPDVADADVSTKFLTEKEARQLIDAITGADVPAVDSLTLDEALS